MSWRINKLRACQVDELAETQLDLWICYTGEQSYEVRTDEREALDLKGLFVIAPTHPTI